jgi:hypothetical protein
MSTRVGLDAGLLRDLEQVAHAGIVTLACDVERSTDAADRLRRESTAWNPWISMPSSPG